MRSYPLSFKGRMCLPVDHLETQKPVVGAVRELEERVLSKQEALADLV